MPFKTDDVPLFDSAEIEEFMAACLIQQKGNAGRIDATDVYAAYRAWAESRNHDVIGRSSFWRAWKADVDELSRSAGRNVVRGYAFTEQAIKAAKSAQRLKRERQRATKPNRNGCCPTCRQPWPTRAAEPDPLA